MINGLFLALELRYRPYHVTKKLRERSVIPREWFRNVWDMCRKNAASMYWQAETTRLHTLWWLQDWAILPVARLSAARWSAGRPVPAWWRAFLVTLLTRADD